MVKRSVRIYIEGGGIGAASDSDFRRSWKKLLSELHELARSCGYHSLELVRGKGRGNAFDRFKGYMKEHPNDLCVLLVDAETSVSEGARVWDVVGKRDGDKWERPTWATERHLYLMVNSVETWLLTDQDALKNYFQQGFNVTPLPTTNLETRSKREIEAALEKATKGSRKGPYQHSHGNIIIGLVRPERVKTLSHGLRLFETLGRLIRGEAESTVACPTASE